MNKLIIATLFLATLCAASSCMNITELKNQPLALFNLGKLKIKTGSLKKIIMLNITVKKAALTQLDNLTISYNTTEYPQFQQLLKEIDIIRAKIARITPIYQKEITRPKRGIIEPYGTLISWLTGIPDADDYRILENKFNSLTAKTEAQFIINQNLERKMK